MREEESPFSFLPSGELRVEKGPISLVLAARWGTEARPEELLAAGRAALGTLDELAAHRRVLSVATGRLRNPAALPPVVRTMVQSAALFPENFTTPLIAVAGTVADVVADYLADRGAGWVVVNNGGDAAVRLAEGETATVGLVARLDAQAPAARFVLDRQCGIGGVTTSGTGGRSFTLGIAEAVTALAATASVADVASTLLANRVDVSADSIRRVRAEEVYPDTDLRGQWVTADVGELTEDQIARALDRGAEGARAMLQSGIIKGAILSLRGRWRFVGWPGEAGVEWVTGF